MGQKVNPYGLRIGVEKYWESQWYDEEYNTDIYWIKELKSYKLSKKVCNFDYSAIRQFTRRVMQKIVRRLVLPRNMLLA